MTTSDHGVRTAYQKDDPLPSKMPTSVEGHWINEYGSMMTLVVEDGQITGFYRSTTGSTGDFIVTGHQQSPAALSLAGVALALAISWHPVGSGQPGPSAHWSSGLSGQVTIKDGVEAMILTHALVASNAVPGRCGIGTYIDKLTYWRDRPWSPIDEHGRPVERYEGSPSSDYRLHKWPSTIDPIVGEWTSPDGIKLWITGTPHENAEFGWLSGVLIDPLGSASPIIGVTDINATKEGIVLQSIAFTVRPMYDGPSAAWAGTLDLESMTLSLLRLSSSSTKPDSTYLQTSASAMKFAFVASPLSKQR